MYEASRIHHHDEYRQEKPKTTRPSPEEMEKILMRKALETAPTRRIEGSVKSDVSAAPKYSESISAKKRRLRLAFRAAVLKKVRGFTCIVLLCDFTFTLSSRWQCTKKSRRSSRNESRHERSLTLKKKKGYLIFRH